MYGPRKTGNNNDDNNVIIIIIIMDAYLRTMPLDKRETNMRLVK